ncbi:MAG: homocysteine S-methyltransferase family protein [Chitinophagales bacterium]|nr:homocysteine S-methyltransferase family protein [Chitinophagales bacterium]
MTTQETLTHLLQKKILIIDGAMGTMIQKHNLTEADYRGTRFADYPSDLKGNNDLLSITQPEIIRNIHLAYLEAGADIIETNTFNANFISQADYDLQDIVYELNVASAKLAKEAIALFQSPEPKFVAGSIGPTNRSASISPDVSNPSFRNVTFDDLVACYKQQVLGLIEGGADILLIETVFDTLNAKACAYSINEIFEEQNRTMPIMISGTITDRSGRNLSGQTIEAFYISLSHVPMISMGLNCAFGAKDMKPYLAQVAKQADTFISCYPNAGLPNQLGQYDQTPEMMADEIKPFLEENLVNILGGCCGSTPAHIAAIANLAAKYEPRKFEKSLQG